MEEEEREILKCPFYFVTRRRLCQPVVDLLAPFRVFIELLLRRVFKNVHFCHHRHRHPVDRILMNGRLHPLTGVFVR